MTVGAHEQAGRVVVLIPDASGERAGMKRIARDPVVPAPTDQFIGEQHVGELRVAVGLKRAVADIAPQDPLERRAAQVPAPVSLGADVHDPALAGPEQVRQQLAEWQRRLGGPTPHNVKDNDA